MFAPALALAAALAPAAEVRVASTSELTAALAAAVPGTRVLVAAGDYGGFRAAGVAGTAEHAIEITAADRAAPPVFRGGVQFSDVAYLVLERLEFAGAPGNGLNVDDGGTFDTPSHHVVLRELAVRDCGGRGNEDGIKLSGLEDFQVLRCTVERWGRGGSGVDMVGCHRGSIEECTIRDRSSDPAASGIQAKGGSREVAIRRCRFEHAGRRAINIGGSTELAYFRPRPEGFEAKDVLVEGCTFVGSDAPIAFVGADGAAVRWNTFVLPRKWVVRILQETRAPSFVPCRGGTFADNLVVYESAVAALPVNVGPETAPDTFRFARNYWYCADDPARPLPRLPVAEEAGRGGADPRFRAPEAGDYGVANDSPAAAAGAHAAPARER